MFLLISSTHFVDVESDIIEEMYKSLKNLEESVASNNEHITILSLLGTPNFRGIPLILGTTSIEKNS